MMIKPSIEELTNESGCNRYTYVIAAAKSAKYVTAKQKLGKDADKSNLMTTGEKQPLRADLFEEKPVSAGIELIHSGDFHIVEPGVGMTSKK